MVCPRWYRFRCLYITFASVNTSSFLSSRQSITFSWQNGMRCYIKNACSVLFLLRSSLLNLTQIQPYFSVKQHYQSTSHLIAKRHSGSFPFHDKSFRFERLFPQTSQQCPPIIQMSIDPRAEKGVNKQTDRRISQGPERTQKPTCSNSPTNQTST